ncbi:MAG: prefoldin subunit beta [Promethearchaeota archaeon]
MEIPPQLKDQLNRFQAMQNRLDMLRQQKITLQTELNSTDSAISALEVEGDDAQVYKSVGGIMLKVERGKLLEELKERKETTEMRITTIEKQETRMTQQLEEMRQQLEANLKGRGL